MNVNFPEATVQRAAGGYVEDLYKARDRDKEAPAQAAPTQPSAFLHHFLFQVSDALIPSAYAVEVSATFQVKNAKTSEIQAHQAARLNQVVEAKKAGHVGETWNGFLSFEHAPQLKPLLKKSLEPLVDAENHDRKTLYAEILSLNHMTATQLKIIETSFARSFQAASSPGTWIQSAEGKWIQK